MKLLILIVTLMTLSNNLALAQKLDAKKTIQQYAELNLSLGYNDGSSISLKVQEQNGSDRIGTFRLYKEANEQLTEERPTLEKQLVKMNAFFERFIRNGDCKNTLVELRTASRGLGLIKGMHSISSTNEESESQIAAQKSLENLYGNLKYKANSICKESIEAEAAELLN